MKVNFHTHTTRCGHASGEDTEYIDFAIDHKFDVLGFSDHGPYPDHDYGSRMPFDELEGYLDAVTEYKRTYKDKLKILCGLEIEYLPRYNSYYEKLLADSRIDYLYMGEHFYDNSQINDISNAYDTDNTSYYIEYAKAIVNAMHTGYYKAFAHPDLIFINELAIDDNCQKAMDIIIEGAAATNSILEYNANGLRRDEIDFPDGKRVPYPLERFWREVAKTNIRVVVGADAHTPAHLWDEYVDASYANLERLGITPVTDIGI